ncbi:MAG: glycoside hydrolase family 140 protein [Bryobacteraceae bacterium]|nr:glycoside hydrolase family 140 protein [Bryobacteraceae bacterium]
MFPLVIAVLMTAACALAQTLPALKVSPDGRFLQTADGKPFLYLADTAWELFHRLNREEADLYLRDRARKGFTVIQAVALAELGGIDVPNAYGHLPLENRDPSKPVEAYFAHVDHIVDRAAALGLRIAMLPTWGRYWSRRDPKLPVIFSPENARAYGRFLGKRYRERPIIWVLGGDEDVRTPDERAVIDAMAEGLAEGGSTHLRTFHPRGPGQSSLHLNDARWLDFHMNQSSHAARDHDNGLFIDHDRALTPVRPTLDGEPRYERISVGFYLRDHNRLDRFDDYDVRQAAYWAMLAGACGHTYGHASIWQMHAPGRQGVLFPDSSWQEALDHPGSIQMGYLRRLFESRAWQKLVPDQSILKSGPSEPGAKIRAARASDGSFAFVYTPRGEPFTVDRSFLKGAVVRESWWDPRYGIATEIHTGGSDGLQTYKPPTHGRGQDWLLILDALPAR